MNLGLTLSLMVLVLSYAIRKILPSIIEDEYTLMINQNILFAIQLLLLIFSVFIILKA